MNTNSSIVEEQVIAVLRRHAVLMSESEAFSVDEVLSDYGLDSMATINLLVDLEQTFEIVIPDEWLSIESFETARSIRNMIVHVLEEKADIS